MTMAMGIRMRMKMRIRDNARESDFSTVMNAVFIKYIACWLDNGDGDSNVDANIPFRNDRIGHFMIPSNEVFYGFFKP